jgi:heme exporter protein A
VSAASGGAAAAHDAAGRADAARLQAHGLALTLGRRFVLLDLELAVGGGEVVAVAGANGAGKSTLLAVLGGQLAPSAGEVWLDGLALHRLGPAAQARAVAFLGHQPGLYLDLTGVENLRLFATLAGLRGGAEAALRALEAVGIDPRDARRPVRQYSRGMTQRVALARLALLPRPLWLLDEPSTGLDLAGRAVLRGVVRGAAAAGAAVVLVSHDPELLAWADRTLLLRGGRLQPAAAGAAAEAAA